MPFREPRASAAQSRRRAFHSARRGMSGLGSWLDGATLLLVMAIMALAGLAHGTMGFGFPLISTPMVALLTDVQTAVLVTLCPNIVVNLISMVRGGEWRHSIARH